MNKLKCTMSLDEFEQYCFDVVSQLGAGGSDLYQAEQIKSGKVVVDITYRILQKPERLKLDFGV